MGRNPRVFITLDPEDADSLTRIAHHKGVPLATIIGQMIRDASPVLRQLADTLDDARGLELKLPAATQAKMADLEKQAQELEHGAQEVLDGIQEQASEKREEQGTKLKRRTAPQGKAL